MSLGTLGIVAMAWACAPPPSPLPTPVPSPLPTRAFVAITAPTATAVLIRTPTATPPRPGPFTARDFDPYYDLYATEREGLFVTTRSPRGRYYYRWDDRRWFAIEDRVWFRAVEDLLIVYPDRVLAP